MELDPGQLAYETRFAGFTLGPRGVAPTWCDLPEAARAIWRRVEHAVMEACVNGVWRLAISAEEVEPIPVLQLPAINPHAAATLAPDVSLTELYVEMDVQTRLVGVSLGFSRGVQPIHVRDVQDRVLTLEYEIDTYPQEQPKTLLIGPGDTADTARAKGFSGNMCQTCGSFSMVRSGTCETCQKCGSTGGCG